MMQDLRYAWRILRKSPGFAAVVVLTLALGIGANTAVFSVVDGVLLQPLPYKDPARLVDVLDADIKDPNLSKTFGTYSDFEEYARSSRSFEKIAFATWATGGASLSGYGPTRHVLSIPVSEDFFAMLAASPALGRTFEHADLTRGCSVVLSDRFWRTTLSAAASIVGKTLNLDSRACTVLGVMPPAFEFYPRQTQMWMLLTPDDPRPRDRLLVITFARLKPGITIAQAQAELTPLHAAIHKSDWQHGFRPAVNNLQDEFTFLAGRNLEATLRLLLAAVGFVLLIACVNVANLLLGRLSGRSREFAVRAALGSGRARLVRQLLIEGLLLALIGGLAGLAIAFGCVRYFVHINPIELPIGSRIVLNTPVLLFNLFVTIATALIFGLAPAWSGSKARAEDGLRAAGRGAIHSTPRRLTSILIGLEISLSMMLVAGASLLMRSVLNMSSAPIGFSPENVYLVNVSLPESRHTDADAAERSRDEMLRRLRGMSEVEQAAAATTFPPFGAGNYELQVEGRDRSGVLDVGQDSVSEDYFSLLRIPVRMGRAFTARDARGTESVAVINEALAREYFPRADALGKRIRAIGFNEGPWLTIVGIVGNEKHPELLREMTWREQAQLYRPISQNSPAAFSIAVRVRPGTVPNASAIERAIAGADPTSAVGEISGLPTLLGNYLKYPRFRAIVINGFAALALLLSAIGLHGLLSQYVSRRTRELGLRMAIGARARDILRLVGAEGGGPVAVGLVLGLAATVLVTRFLASLLYGVTPLDPVSLLAAPVFLLAAALIAMAKPALDALSVDPAVALRDE